MQKTSPRSFRFGFHNMGGKRAALLGECGWLSFNSRLTVMTFVAARKVRSRKWTLWVDNHDSWNSFAAFTALIAPQDKILSLAMSDGGHRTHGYQTTTKKMSATSIYFQTLSYFLDPSTQLIDYSNLRSLARTHQPQLIICGACNYTRDYDWKQLREICDEIGAWLVGDIAHTCGLVIAGELTSPFDHCDVVTTTTWVHTTPLSPSEWRSHGFD